MYLLLAKKTISKKMFYKILTFYFFIFSPINFIFKKIILFRRIIFIFLYLQNVNSKYKF